MDALEKKIYRLKSELESELDYLKAMLRLSDSLCDCRGRLSVNTTIELKEEAKKIREELGNEVKALKLENAALRDDLCSLRQVTMPGLFEHDTLAAEYRKAWGVSALKAGFTPEPPAVDGVYMKRSLAEGLATREESVIVRRPVRQDAVKHVYWKYLSALPE